MSRLSLLVLLTSISILFSCADTLAQSIEHSRIKSDEQLSDAYVDLINDEYKILKKEIDGPYKKELKEYYESRTSYLESMAKRDYLILEQSTHEMVQSIIDEIARTNTQYDLSKVKPYFSRQYWPNAYSVGEGTICVNVGFLPHLESVDEFAFTLCHEVAHFLLKHSERSLIKQLDYINSKETQEKIKEIKNTEYYQNAKLKELVVDNLFSQRAHSRDEEGAADSLGFELFKNTKYHKGAAISLIEKLKVMNEYIDTSDIRMDRLLWIEIPENEESKGVKIRDEDGIGLEFGDALETHPKCDDRIAALNEMAKEQSVELDRGATPDPVFQESKTIMELEMIESYIFYLKFDRALLKAARLLKKYPDSEYLQSIICYTYSRMILERKNYNLVEFASMPHNNEDQAFTDLLSILHFNRIGNLTKSAEKIMDRWFEEDSMNERMWVSKVIMAELKDNGVEVERVQNIYKKKFPEGRYNNYVWGF